MKGFKDSTRTKYMCGGPVKKFAGGVMEEGGMTPGGVAPKKVMKKAVPVASGQPMIRRNKGGLTAMPKGKC